METFGVGGVARPGSWTGICLRVGLAAGLQPRAAAVQLLIRDEDGDTMYAERRVTLSPGREQPVWLYVRVPANLSSTTVFTVVVHELTEAGGIARRLGVSRITPSRVARPEDQLIGVIGRRAYGVEQYELRAPPRSASSHIGSAHERIEVVAGLPTTPQSFPDRWMGLAQYSSILWTDGLPSTLGVEGRAQALREWVYRGGHLIIVLPPVGGGWFAADNPIVDILPDARVRRVEGADLEPYRELLTDVEFVEQRLPGDVTLHTFTVESGTPAAEATQVINGPDGCVVVRRLVGTGMVTIVGIDLDSIRYAGGQMLRADAFWHRIFGNRFDVPSVSRVREQEQSGFPQANQYPVDSGIASAITRSGVAGVGILLAVIVFVAYWLIAGPGGYALLRMRGLARHAWTIFVLTVAVFTLVAWIGARSLRQTDFSMEHLTLLDHVYGQPVQRTTTWASVFLPEYSDETVRVGEAGLDPRWIQAATTWSDPYASGGTLSFPDARGYRVESDAPFELRVPSRATAKQFRFDWLGGPRWSMPRPVDEAQAPSLDSRRQITGALIHDLPADMTDVLIILVEEQTLPNQALGRQPGELWARVRVVQRRTWQRGEVLDLASTFSAQAEGPLAQRAGTDYFKSLTEGLVGTGSFPGLGGAPPAQRARDITRDMARIALLPVLEPPAWGRVALQSAGQPLRAGVNRRETHGLDLGKWFTQPCLIIVGHVNTDACPTPVLSVRADREQEIPANGRTVVRWIYPMTPRPVRFGTAAAGN
ncbi:MAG: hypothetical protein EA380_07080 [Phycisphaeraceae bacterium]|nr:MAG: hypothetical protein EA380_07080 [Phycisphaeraceae bacterium]